MRPVSRNWQKMSWINVKAEFPKGLNYCTTQVTSMKRIGNWSCELKIKVSGSHSVIFDHTMLSPWITSVFFRVHHFFFLKNWVHKHTFCFHLQYLYVHFMRYVGTIFQFTFIHYFIYLTTNCLLITHIS